MKLVYKGPLRYKVKVTKLNSLMGIDPFSYVASLCNLKGLPKIILIHKPIKLSAEFQEPNKIILDLRNNIKYINLSLTHEYTHLLLRYHHWAEHSLIKSFIKKYIEYKTCPMKNSFDYSIEQSIAILIQLSYEDKTKIDIFTRRKAIYLMEYMNVLEIGQFFLLSWENYWIKKYPFHSENFSNILDFIGFVLRKYDLNISKIINQKLR